MTDIFVYGTLTNPRVVKRITGKNFRQISAILENYKKEMPGTGYSYIVSKKGATVKRGFVLCDIDDESLEKIDRFEAVGELYERVEINVLVDGHKRRAHTYVANIDGIRNFFGPEQIEYEVKIEEHLERKLENIMGDMSEDVEPELVKQAESELLGDTVELLINAHFDYSPDLMYKIEETLSSPDLPTLEKVKSDPEVIQYADAYIKLAVKHIVFNQIEKKIRKSYRNVTKISDEFHQHTVSNLIALVYTNQNSETLDAVLEWLGIDKLNSEHEYIDYAIRGIRIAELLYDKDKLDFIVDWVIANSQPGLVPLGAEIEMSNVGEKAISAKPGQDEIYDCFYYFNDFDMLRRCWKLGGHIDHHRFQDIQRAGRHRGFFEYALGRVCCLEENLSKPVTNDPWILSQLICHGVKFAGIAPYSLHLTLQLDNFDLEKPGNPEYHICLLMLGGDLGLNEEGKLVEKRITNGEIIDSYGGLHFSCENAHIAPHFSVGKLSLSDDSGEITKEEGTKVTEYKFARLRKDKNFEPLIMALKGFQIAYAPRPLISRIRFIDQGKLPEVKALMNWANSPYPLTKSVLTEFLSLVEQGLMNEKEGKPAHKTSYINDCLTGIENSLNKTNDLILTFRKNPAKLDDVLFPLHKKKVLCKAGISSSLSI